jgi:anthranilate synthase component 1
MATDYKPTLNEVRELANEGNMIAVHSELPADLETPVSVYLKLRGRDEDRGGLSFLLESVEKGEVLGRYSFIGVHPPMTVTAHGDEVVVGGAGGTVLEVKNGDPLEVVKELMAGRRPVPQPELPRFNGGVVGYFGYDLVRFMERLPETAEHDLDVPDMMMLFCDNLVVFDHVRHKLVVIANMRARDGDVADLRAAYADAIARIEKIIDDIKQPLTPPESKPVAGAGDWRSNFTQEQHESNVRGQGVHQGRRYFPGGAEPAPEPRDRSRSVHHLPGAANAESVALHVLSRLQRHCRSSVASRCASSAPARRCTCVWRTSSPICIPLPAHVGVGRPQKRMSPGRRSAGRSQGAGRTCDAGRSGRNDLGRVCEYGSVTVPTMMQVERYSHVMHIVSDVRGKVQPQHDAFSLLRATFPAGTVSGAPKVRAMEIIEELEGTRRGPYAGAVGYICNDGSMDTCITIRTITMQGRDVQPAGRRRHRRRQRSDG